MDADLATDLVMSKDKDVDGERWRGFFLEGLAKPFFLEGLAKLCFSLIRQAIGEVPQAKKTNSRITARPVS